MLRRRYAFGSWLFGGPRSRSEGLKEGGGKIMPMPKTEECKTDSRISDLALRCPFSNEASLRLSDTLLEQNPLESAAKQLGYESAQEFLDELAKVPPVHEPRHKDGIEEIFESLVHRLKDCTETDIEFHNEILAAYRILRRHVLVEKWPALLQHYDCQTYSRDIVGDALAVSLREASKETLQIFKPEYVRLESVAHDLARSIADTRDQNKESGRDAVIVPLIVGFAFLFILVTMFRIGYLSVSFASDAVSQRAAERDLQKRVRRLLDENYSKEPLSFGELVGKEVELSKPINDTDEKSKKQLQKALDKTLSLIKWKLYESSYASSIRTIEQRIIDLKELKKKINLKSVSGIRAIIAEKKGWMNRCWRIRVFTTAMVFVVSFTAFQWLWNLAVLRPLQAAVRAALKWLARCLSLSDWWEDAITNLPLAVAGAMLAQIFWEKSEAWVPFCVGFPKFTEVSDENVKHFLTANIEEYRAKLARNREDVMKTIEDAYNKNNISRESDPEKRVARGISLDEANHDYLQS